ncbi:hypothetical protein [Mucilaginibacter pedocola]|uniref:Uncharacterized protein n=1 Tax=Mucilaginibacter pedocola TaxID=1792845 RepID=A0A1S9PE63_9SPHI|nr:hypothetical protein [Mucilaginibacter pedocola]OOQ59246.1 hypothetical protein BC343_28405 [Mucilaginibacter pedocola]
MTAKIKRWLYIIIGIVAAPILILAIFVLWDYPFLLVLLAVFLFWLVTTAFDIYHRLKPTVWFREHLAFEFKKTLQYTILEERLLTAKEAWDAFEPLDIPFDSSFPALAHKNFGHRYFRVEDPNGYQFELVVTVIQTWHNKFRYRIESTSRIRD